MAPRELSEYLDDDPSGRLMVGDLANRYGWTRDDIWHVAESVVTRLTRPNGLAIDLVWNGATLVRAVRSGGLVCKIEAEDGVFAGPAMLQIVAGWLEDTE